MRALPAQEADKMSNAKFFKQLLEEGRILALDGGMGTMLQAAGLPPGAAPELWCLANQEILAEIQKEYARAGANIITTCTFGANPYKLPPDADVFSINRQLALIARKAAESAKPEQPVFIAGDLGPSGHFLRPLGDLEPQSFVDAYARQIEGLVEGGVDLLFVETQFDLAEARTIVRAARKVCDLPVMASMTFEHGLSLTGSTPEIFAQTMLNMGVDVVGTNCSLGPDEMLPVVESLLKTPAPYVLAEPNAGLPRLENGATVFPMGPEAFAEKTAAFARLGARILGGCCGTTPAHIRMLKEKLAGMDLPRRKVPEWIGITLTTRSRLVSLGGQAALAVIGERINPTGKPALAESLRNGDYSVAAAFADEQAAAGAAVIDVNVGAPLVDEAAVLPQLAELLSARVAEPLSLDSSNSEAIAKSLPFCPGSALVNSISGEADRMDALGPLCRDWGAPFILLPLMGASLPEKARERIAIAEKLLDRVESLHIPRHLVLVDILALSVSSQPAASAECLEMLRWCARQKLPSTIGLSNISFGLPARGLLNTVFLCMCRGAGLSSCIANPSAPRLREAMDAMRLLDGHDRDAAGFIAGYAAWKPGGNTARAAAASAPTRTLYDAVVAGDRENVANLVDGELAAGRDPMDVVNNALIPAITEVGAKYERKEYFLPQLVRGAETMQLAFDRLRPFLKDSQTAESRPVIVMATVEGDIHDIGKNIVSLLLGNHGFEVVDAGKDAKAEDIVACAESSGASIIGLSALMTTTMTRMEDTIRLVREKKLPMRVMVGGAAVTELFAASIGADAYCADAVSGVKMAQKLIREMQAEKDGQVSAAAR